MRHHYPSYRKIRILIICLLSMVVMMQSNSGFSQTQDSTVKKSSPAFNTGVEEDIQRFFGYEDPLLVRYLSLPYDSVMTSNWNYNTVDLGFILFMLLPLAFFLFGETRPWQKLSWMAFLSLILIIAVPSSYLASGNLSAEAGLPQLNAELGSLSLGADPISFTYRNIQWLCFQVYLPFQDIISSVSGSPDHITYPVLLLLLAGVMAMAIVRMRKSDQAAKSLVLFLLVYGSLWLLLSPGLPWYAFLLFAFGPILVVRSFTSDAIGNLIPGKVGKGVLYGVVGIWLLASSFLRMGNYSSWNPSADLKIFYTAPALYRSGDFDRDRVIDMFRGQFTSAIRQINSESKSLIYTVGGTQLPFFVEKGDERCYSDKFLSVFKKLNKKHPDKLEVIDVLKASGFRYICIDLNLSQMDQTKEKTLVEKFNAFMNVLYKNPKVELVATNRRIKSKKTGQERYGVFLNNADLVHAGHYAVYRIK